MVFTPCRCKGCLNNDGSSSVSQLFVNVIDTLTGLPAEPPGIDSSITLFGGKTYTDPLGSNDCAVDAPLMIWRSTGTLGGTKDALLTEKLNAVALNSISRFKLTSAAPTLGIPGAAGF